MVHIGHASRIPLRRIADLLAGWQRGDARRSDALRSDCPARHRAPHVWLADGRSTLDLFGRSFTLLPLGANPPVASEFESAAERLGVPVSVVALNEPEVAAAYERALVLVRPDGHVAWRGDVWPDLEKLLDCVRGVSPAPAP
ncbi:MAG: hypothetical protein WDN69_32645 [Aliidongia sp.]